MINSSRLWHYFAVLFIVVAILGLSIKHIFVDANRWEKVSAQSLQEQMQKGLAQIYWHWQQSGRPDVIAYQPENAAEPAIIAMSQQGLPIVAANKKACESMLSWFVTKKAFNNQVKVSTNYSDTLNSDTTNSDTLKNASTAKGRDIPSVQDSCKFEYAGYVFIYNTSSGALTFR